MAEKTRGKSLGHRFETGNKAAAGNKGGGRPPDWLKAKCSSIVERSNLIEFLRDVADGKDIDQAINDNGECLKIPAGIKERLRAVEMLMDRGWGKPGQSLDVKGELSHNLNDFVERV